MSEFSTYLANELLDHVFLNGAADYTAPTTIYVALFTSGTNLETNSQTNEVSGTNYARTSAAFATVASGGSISNTSDITFPAAGAGGWGTITHAAVMDASTTGQILMYSPLDSSKTVNDGDTFKILTGQLTLEFQ